MYQGQTVFSQLMEFLPRHTFRKCVNRYQGNYRMRSFSCYDQFLCMAFAQLTSRESLRDIECCLCALEEKLYHAGFRGNVSRSTLADANESRDWRIYADFAQQLIHEARTLYLREDFGLQLTETVYALDSSTIDLCLSLFPWARFRTTKAGIKLHTLLDLRGSIPAFIMITEAKLHDVNILDSLVPEPGAIYVMDRGYLDFARLYALHQAPAFFVIRSKTNTDLHRLYSNPVDKETGVRCDQIVALLIVLIVLEITRRSIGITLVLIVFVGVAYAMLGPHLPEIISHRGYTLKRILSQIAVGTEGLFGSTLGIASTYVAGFIFFAGFLEAFGGLRIFMKLALSISGALAGGPANGYRLLVDSSLDWGQDLKGLKRWIVSPKFVTLRVEKSILADMTER